MYVRGISTRRTKEPETGIGASGSYTSQKGADVFRYGTVSEKNTMALIGLSPMRQVYAFVLGLERLNAKHVSHPSPFGQYRSACPWISS